MGKKHFENQHPPSRFTTLLAHMCLWKQPFTTAASSESLTTLDVGRDSEVCIRLASTKKAESNFMSSFQLWNCRAFVSLTAVKCCCYGYLWEKSKPKKANPFEAHRSPESVTPL